MGRLALVSILAITIVLAACGGSSGPELTIEEYFRQFEGILSDAKADVEQQYALATTTPAPEPRSDEERVALARENYLAFISLSDEYLGRLRDLNPPAEARDGHKAYVEAAEESAERLRDSIMSSAFEEYVISMQRAKTYEDIRAANDAFNDPGYAAVQDRLDEACRELKALAAEHDLSFSQSCDD